MFGMGGCASPAYSGDENIARTLRAWDFDYKQAVDDFNYEIMFLPPSHMSKWNLR